jgi:hypothetical protein
MVDPVGPYLTDLPAMLYGCDTRSDTQGAETKSDSRQIANVLPSTRNMFQ